jgi:hypothetical protein
MNKELLLLAVLILLPLMVLAGYAFSAQKGTELN